MIDILISLFIQASDPYEEAMWSGDIYCAWLLEQGGEEEIEVEQQQGVN